VTPLPLGRDASSSRNGTSETVAWFNATKYPASGDSLPAQNDPALGSVRPRMEGYAGNDGILSLDQWRAKRYLGGKSSYLSSTFQFVGVDFAWSKLESYVQELIKESRGMELNFAERMVMRVKSRRKLSSMIDFLPPELRTSLLFTVIKSTEGKFETARASLDDVLAQAIEEGCILSAYTTTDGKLERVEEDLLRRGKTLLPQLSWNDTLDPQRRILEHFMRYQYAKERYSLPDYEAEDLLPKAELDFLNAMRIHVANSPLKEYIGLVAMASFGDVQRSYFRDDRDVDYGRPYKLAGGGRQSGYGKSLREVKRSWKERMKDTWHNRHQLNIDRKHDFIQAAVNVYAGGVDPELAPISILTALAYDLSITDPTLPSRMESYIKRTFIGPPAPVADAKTDKRNGFWGRLFRGRTWGTGTH
jgi:hypothetical protein